MDLPSSVWGNLYKVQARTARSRPPKGYDAAGAVKAFENHLRSSEHLMKLIPSLADSVLVCHCQAGQPCHADAIIKVFNEVAGRAGSVVYVGQSDSAGRFPRTDWTSPFQPGPHGTHE
eukprot:6621614-Heterocapsa_arctica.AAC.1